MVSFTPGTPKLGFLMVLYVAYPAPVDRNTLEQHLGKYTSHRPLMYGPGGEGQKAAETVKYDLATQGLLTIAKEGSHRR
jgi:hypothetical protein